MRRLPMIAVLLLSACHRQTEPERALERYAAAVRRHDCAAAYAQLSSSTVEALQYLVEHPSYGTSRSAQELGCNLAWIEDWKSYGMRTRMQAPDAAIVTVKKSVATGPALPGFSPMFRKDVDEPVEMVRENGEWRLVQRFMVDMVAARRNAIEKELRMREEYMRQAAAGQR